MGQQVTGIVKIKLDGGIIESENEATLNPGGRPREPVVHGGKTFYSESEEAPSVKFKVMLTSDVDVIEIAKFKEKTLTFITDSGHRYLIRNAFTVSTVEHGKTSADVEMSGDFAEKV